MKNPKTLFPRLLLPLVAACAALGADALAGEGTVGNGGSALVCRNPDGSISRAELLDLFEASDLAELLDQPVLQIDRSHASVDGAKEAALGRLAFDPAIAEDVRATLEDIRLRVQEIPSRFHLTPVHEVLPPFKPRGCDYELVINYINDRKVSKDVEVHGALSVTDQAALLVHEAIYRMARERSGVTDSSGIRPLVAQLFAVNADASRIQALATKYLKDPYSGVRLSGSGELALSLGFTVDVSEVWRSNMSEAACTFTLLSPSGSPVRDLGKRTFSSGWGRNRSSVVIAASVAEVERHVLDVSCKVSSGTLGVSLVEGGEVVHSIRKAIASGTDARREGRLRFRMLPHPVR